MPCIDQTKFQNTALEVENKIILIDFYAMTWWEKENFKLGTSLLMLVYSAHINQTKFQNTTALEVENQIILIDFYLLTWREKENFKLGTSLLMSDYSPQKWP